jgi:hypothetical protein
MSGSFLCAWWQNHMVRPAQVKVILHIVSHGRLDKASGYCVLVRTDSFDGFAFCFAARTSKRAWERAIDSCSFHSKTSLRGSSVRY